MTGSKTNKTIIKVDSKPIEQALKEGKRGKPTPYKEEYVADARMLCQQGAIGLELAAFFGVAESTIYRWCARHPEFAEACKLGKAVADERVERSLYQRAVGYSYTAERPFIDREGNPIIVKYEIYEPPNVAACRYWLNNRKPDEWKDRMDFRFGAAPAAQAVIQGVAVDEV